MNQQQIEIAEKLINAIKLNNFEIISAIINSVILIVTAIIIYKYTCETNLLRKLSARPVLKIINTKSNGSFNIANIGKGPALNVELRISQVHKNGGRTNLRNLLENEEQRHFINLGENEEVNTKGEGTTYNYIKADKQGFEHGEKDFFQIVATYCDIYNKKHYTVALFKVIGQDYILKKTFVGEYNGSNLPRAGNLDWLS